MEEFKKILVYLSQGNIGAVNVLTDMFTQYGFLTTWKVVKYFERYDIKGELIWVMYKDQYKNDLHSMSSHFALCHEVKEEFEPERYPDYNRVLQLIKRYKEN